MGTGVSVDWGGDPNLGLRRRIVASHYPSLRSEWRSLERRRGSPPRAAPQALRDRFAREVASLSLSERYNVNAIVNGFGGWTERRALEGTLGESWSREQLWNVWGPVTHGPPVGAEVKGTSEIAIAMGGIPTRTTAQKRSS